MKAEYKYTVKQLLETQSRRDFSILKYLHKESFEGIL